MLHLSKEADSNWFIDVLVPRRGQVGLAVFDLTVNTPTRMFTWGFLLAVAVLGFGIQIRKVSEYRGDEFISEDEWDEFAVEVLTEDEESYK